MPTPHHRSILLLVLVFAFCFGLTFSHAQTPKATPKAATPPPKAAPAHKGHKLHPKYVAKNELLDHKFLTPYKAGIEALNKNQPDDAIKHAQAAMQQRPNSGRALLVLATAYKVKGIYNTALQHYQQAAKRFNPKSELYEGAQALYNVAICFELLGQRPNAIAAWQIYVNYANTYTMQSPQRDHAAKRIEALQSVKGPPSK